MGLLVDLERALILRRRSPRTVEAYGHWVRRFVRFHGMRHPKEMGESEVRDFLEDLAVVQDLASSTQDQALCALVFLYRHVLQEPLGELGAFSRARRPKKLPVVLTDEEARSIIAQLASPWKLLAMLMYGSGLRVGEAVSLRVKDLDFGRREIFVRDTKSRKDRITVLPTRMQGALRQQMEIVSQLRDLDQERGDVTAPLPHSLARKKPEAGKQLAWAYLFPSSRPRASKKGAGQHRWHVSPSSMQREIRPAILAAGITKAATCHSLRHTFATELLRGGTDVRTVQELLGHKNLHTTQIYLHLMGQGAFGVRSPLD